MIYKTKGKYVVMELLINRSLKHYKKGTKDGWDNYRSIILAYRWLATRVRYHFELSIIIAMFLPVKRYVVFYSDFACLSIHARHNISIWNIASIEMMDEKLYIKIWLVRWQSSESVWEFSTLFISSLYIIGKTTCNFYISSRRFGHFKTELSHFHYENDVRFSRWSSFKYKKNVRND